MWFSEVKGYKNKDILISNNASLKDTIKLIKEITYENIENVKDSAVKLKGNTNEFDYCRNLFFLVLNNFDYVEDKDEQVRTPARLVKDGFGDCDCFTVFINCYLLAVGINVKDRITDYGEGWQHIYPVAILSNGQEVILDVVYKYFNKEKKYKDKFDIKMKLEKLAGLEPSSFAKNKLGSEFYGENGYMADNFNINYRDLDNEGNPNFLNAIYKEKPKGVMNKNFQICNDNTFTTAVNKRGRCTYHEGAKSFWKVKKDKPQSNMVVVNGIPMDLGACYMVSQDEQDDSCVGAIFKEKPRGTILNKGYQVCMDKTYTTAVNKKGRCTYHGGAVYHEGHKYYNQNKDRKLRGTYFFNEPLHGCNNSLGGIDVLALAEAIQTVVKLKNELKDLFNSMRSTLLKIPLIGKLLWNNSSAEKRNEIITNDALKLPSQKIELGNGVTLFGNYGLTASLMYPQVAPNDHRSAWNNTKCISATCHPDYNILFEAIKWHIINEANGKLLKNGVGIHGMAQDYIDSGKSEQLLNDKAKDWAWAIIVNGDAPTLNVIQEAVFPYAWRDKNNEPTVDMNGQAVVPVVDKTSGNTGNNTGNNTNNNTGTGSGTGINKTVFDVKGKNVTIKHLILGGALLGAGFLGYKLLTK